MSQEEENNSAERVFRFKRLTQLFWAVEFTFIALLIAELMEGEVKLAAAIAVLAVILSSVYFFIKKGFIDQATTVLFIILVVVISALMWSYGGLQDETLLAFPIFLLFSAMLGNKKLFFVLLGYAVATTLAIGIANETGWHVNESPDGGLHSAILITILLLAISYSIWLLSNDLGSVFDKLTEENRRAKESQSRIQRLVHHDALTNLPNRLLAKERFEHAIAASKRKSTLVCLMYLDLDNFKAINDSLGHQSGDNFLKETASRLQALTRESDTVCRQGGDEFLVILESIESEEDIAGVAAKILETVKKPIALNDSSVVATVSMGITVAPDDGVDFDTICKEADMAMYHAKELGRNGYCFYDQAMDERAQDNLQLLSDMREAISLQQFELHYQPKVDLHTGALVGAEALIRWPHPTRGFIPPQEFIPLAERSGIIVDISEWVVEESCRECKRWQDMGHEHLSIAVNVSSIEFKRGRITTIVSEALQKSGLSPDRLELELTESLLLADSSGVGETLEHLRGTGVTLSIDDFGTGYSNLGYLKKFDVSVLKIDQSFVRKTLTSAEDRAIVQAIIQIASSLNLKTIAEGVENREVAEILKGMGCDMGQGFLWSKPLTAEEFLDYLPQ